MRKIGLLINPHAKKARIQPRLIQDLIASFPDSSAVWMPKNLAELSQITKSILDQKIEVVFLSGGDGTFRATVESFLNHHSPNPLPSFVLLQGGTGGLYSKHYFGARHPLIHLKDVLNQLRSDKELKTTSINILDVNGHYGFIFAIGGFANVLTYYMSHKERSIALANWILFKTMLSFIFGTKLYRSLFPRMSVNVKHDGKNAPMEITTLSCSSLPVGYGLNPYYGTTLNKYFSVLIFHRSPFRIFFNLFSLIKKRPIHAPNVKQFAASSIEIFLSQPLPPVVDADMLESTTHIHVKLGPQINLLTA